VQPGDKFRPRHAGSLIADDQERRLIGIQSYKSLGGIGSYFHLVSFSAQSFLKQLYCCLIVLHNKDSLWDSPLRLYSPDKREQF
jgi:hypothetical protein